MASVTRYGKTDIQRSVNKTRMQEICPASKQRAWPIYA